MIGVAARYLVVSLLVLGIVLPQAAVALAALGLADGRTLVICTGDGLRTIRLDDDGDPVDMPRETELCALVHALDTSGAAGPGRIQPRLLDATAPILPRPSLPDAQVYSPSQPRAPPARSSRRPRPGMF